MRIRHAIIAFLFGVVITIMLLLFLRRENEPQVNSSAPDNVELPSPVQGDWESFLEDLREAN